MVSQQEIELYKRILPSCKVIFDVGCKYDNVFDELQSGLDIHLFDPNINPWQIKEKIKGKGNIVFNNYALGNRIGEIDFYYKYDSINKREEEPKFAELHESQKVFMWTIDDYCFSNHIEEIDLLKIDTEGYDFEVIKGAGEMIRNVRYIQFEDWDEKLTKEILKYLDHKKIPFAHTFIDSNPKNIFVHRL